MVNGNGRTERLLLNWQPLQAGIPLTVIQVELRNQIYRRLQRQRRRDEFRARLHLHRRKPKFWLLRSLRFLPLMDFGVQTQVGDRPRYLGALDQGHSGQRLEVQILVADAVERSLDLAAGRK